MSQSITLEIPDDVRDAILENGERTGREFADIAREMLSEATRMRRFPGIVFADSPIGRVARIAGTDLDVYRIIGTFNRNAQQWDRLRRAFGDLGEEQLRLALAYWRTYPAEIHAQMDADDRLAIEAVWADHPMSRPPWR